jgi:broad specificity phosphatase PhoE
VDRGGWTPKLRRMPPQKLMIIRHGEKEPDAGPPPYGVNADGEQDKHSLSPRGWQRAGALVPFFRKAWVRGIEVPDAIYASKVGASVLMADGHDISQSLRPQQTVTPLVDAIGPAKGLQTPCAVGEEAGLVQTIVAQENGVVLVAWEHHHIPAIASAFATQAPASWPASSFDAVWILTQSADGTYAFDEVQQALLSGDAPS